MDYGTCFFVVSMSCARCRYARAIGECLLADEGEAAEYSEHIVATNEFVTCMATSNNLRCGRNHAQCLIQKLDVLVSV